MTTHLGPKLAAQQPADYCVVSGINLNTQYTRSLHFEPQCRVGTGQDKVEELIWRELSNLCQHGKTDVKRKMMMKMMMMMMYILLKTVQWLCIKLRATRYTLFNAQTTECTMGSVHSQTLTQPLTKCYTIAPHSHPC